jgi:hypothetical protein
MNTSRKTPATGLRCDEIEESLSWLDATKTNTARSRNGAAKTRSGIVGNSLAVPVTGPVLFTLILNSLSKVLLSSRSQMVYSPADLSGMLTAPEESVLRIFIVPSGAMT